jgi:hypothetical protein
MSVAPDSIGPNPQGDSSPPAPTPEPAPTFPPIQPAVGGSPGMRAWVSGIGAALVAAFLAWGIGEKTYNYYQPSIKKPISRDFTAMNREERIAAQKNTTLAFGTFGAVLGLLSGLAGGAARRTIAGGMRAALAGLLLGGITAAAVSYGLAPVFARYYSDEGQSLLLSFLVRGAICAVVGTTAGLALGWGWQAAPGIPRALIGGLAGGVCGTVAFEVVNAVLFPGDRNDAVIPSSTSARLLAYLLVAVGAASGAVLFGGSRAWPSSRLTKVPSQPVISLERLDHGLE